MSTRFVLVILLSTLVGIWILSACAPSTPAPPSTPPSTVSGGPDCEETIFDMDDPSRVFESEAAEGYYIYWTFHINFPKSGDSGEPVVCFRLYGRDASSSGGYVDLSDGAQVMETCTTVREVNYSEDSVERSSRGHPTDVSTGVAEMSGGGYITCTINLREWAASLSIPAGISDQTESAFNQFKENDTQFYETFSIVAAGALDVNAGEGENPIVYYQPRPEGVPPMTGESPVTMALPTVLDADILTGTFAATLGNEHYSPPESSVEGCSYDLKEPRYWWTNFDTTRVGSPPERMALTFDNRGAIDGTLATCLELTPAPPHELAFWTGPAVLYIGCHPNGASDCASHLKGRLYGIVFDPLDSKPQEQ